MVRRDRKKRLTHSDWPLPLPGATEKIKRSPAYVCFLDWLIEKQWNWTCIGNDSFGEESAVSSLAATGSFRRN